MGTWAYTWAERGQKYCRLRPSLSYSLRGHQSLRGVDIPEVWANVDSHQCKYFT